MLAWYPFNDSENVGKDASGNENHAVAKGSRQPEICEVGGRKAAVFHGADLVADAGYACPVGEWVHIAMTVTGTKEAELVVPVKSQITLDGENFDVTLPANSVNVLVLTCA